MAASSVARALALFGAASAFKLAVLHTNDHHSHLTGERLTLPGGSFGFQDDVRVYYGGYPRMATAYRELAAAAAAGGYEVLKLHAGDAVTGTSYWSLFKGTADAEMMAHVCFDAMALGNHEFDEGDAVLADFITALNSHSSLCAATAVLGANVVPGASSPLIGKIAKSSTFTLNGERVGVVGIDIRSKTMQSSQPSPGTELTDERTAAQAEIDSLIAAGVNKIIALTHIGYDLDTTWMVGLNGVDIVIGGDSHTLLGDSSTDSAGFSTGGAYPTEATNGNGKKVCVATAWEYAKAIGHLAVEFDANGDVTSCGGSPKFAFDEASMTFGDGTALSSTQAGAVSNHLVALGGQWVVAAKDSATQTALAGYEGQVSALKAQTIATVPTALCFDRFPGQGRSTICTREMTQEHGGAACQLVAKAFMTITRTADFAIQNGGGCRTDIAAGTFSVDNAYEMLPFSNTLVTMVLTGAQVKALLEEALDYALSPDGSTGAYPYASGLRFAVDASQASGSRFSRVEINARLEGTWAPIDDAASYTVATNSFIAGGRDGYVTFRDAANLVNTFTEYAEGFVQYARTVSTLVEPPVSEFSTQAYTDSSGDVFSTWAEPTTTTRADAPGTDRDVSSAFSAGGMALPLLLTLPCFGL